MLKFVFSSQVSSEVAEIQVVNKEAHQCARKFRLHREPSEKKSHLDEDIEEDQRQDDEAGEGRGQQQDHQHLEQLEQVAQHHLEAVRDHAVDGVHVAGEAVEQVPTGRDLEEGDGRAQDAEQQGGVKLARGHHTAQGDGQRRPQLA